MVIIKRRSKKLGDRERRAGLPWCTVKGTDTGGDIVTDKLYDNFELAWEWKIDKGSNSGILYHVVEDA
jgi:hypothetical protein